MGITQSGVGRLTGGLSLAGYLFGRTWIFVQRPPVAPTDEGPATGDGDRLDVDVDGVAHLYLTAAEWVPLSASVTECTKVTNRSEALPACAGSL